MTYFAPKKPRENANKALEYQILNNKNIKYIFLILAFLIVTIGVYADTELTSCQNIITSSGNYYITQDFDCNSDYNYFIDASYDQWGFCSNTKTSYDINFDGRGHKINWKGTNDFIRYYFNYSSTGDIEIHNLDLNGGSIKTYINYYVCANLSKSDIKIYNSNIENNSTDTIKSSREKGGTNLIIEDSNIINTNNSYYAIKIDEYPYECKNNNGNIKIKNSKIESKKPSLISFNTRYGEIGLSNIIIENVNNNKEIDITNYPHLESINMNLNNTNQIKINLELIDNGYININNSNIINSNINNSNLNINNSDINNVIIYDGNIHNSYIYDSNINNSNIWDSNIYNSNFYDSNFYNIYTPEPSYNITYDYIDFNFFIPNYTEDINWSKFYWGINKTFNTVDNNSDFNGFVWNSFRYNIDIPRDTLNHIYFYNTDDHNNQYDPAEPLIGYLFLKFKEENKNTNIIPTSVILDGISYTGDIDTNGGLVIDFNSSDSNIHTLVVSKTGYGTRTYTLYLNDANNYDYNISLLQDTVGKNMVFEFYNESGTNLIPNEYIKVYLDDTNYSFVGAGITNSLSKITFFLNANETDYNFWVETDGGLYYYTAVPVHISIPKNEKTTTTTISPFDVDVGGLGSQSYTDQTSDLNILVVSNTYNTYDITISDTNDDYFPRIYNIKVPGNPDIYNLQPYLISTDAAITAYFFVKNKTDNTPLKYVYIDIYKNVGTGENVLVESVKTDSTGTAISTLYALDQYSLYFTYDGEIITDVDMYPAEIVASVTNYYVYLVIEDTANGFTPSEDIIISINNGYSSIEKDYGLGTFDFNVDVTGEEIYKINVTITNDDNTLINTDYMTVTNGMTKSYSFVDANFEDYTFGLKVCVTVYDSDLNILNSSCKNLALLDNTRSWNPISTLKSYFDDMEHSDFYKSLFVAFMVLIGVCAIMTFTSSKLMLTIFGSAIILFFVFIGFFNSWITNAIMIIIPLIIFYVILKYGENERDIV